MNNDNSIIQHFKRHLRNMPRPYTQISPHDEMCETLEIARMSRSAEPAEPSHQSPVQRLASILTNGLIAIPTVNPSSMSDSTVFQSAWHTNTSDNSDTTYSVITSINISTDDGSLSGDMEDYVSTILDRLFSQFRTSEQSDVILPLTDDAFNQLAEMEYAEFAKSNETNSDMNAQDKCTICQDNFEEKTIIKILPCKHIFHKECIHVWLKNYHHKCPICRQSCGEHNPIL